MACSDIVMMARAMHAAKKTDEAKNYRFGVARTINGPATPSAAASVVKAMAKATPNAAASVVKAKAEATPSAAASVAKAKATPSAAASAKFSSNAFGLIQTGGGA